MPIRTGGDENPVIIIPGGGGGDSEILLLAGMAGSLNTNRDIYAVGSRAMDPSWTRAGTLKEHAAAVLEELKQVVSGGNWVLIGDCVAGAVAMEVACQAQARGLAPEAVALLDPFTPAPQPFLSRVLGHPNKVQESALARSTPDQIRDYYRLVKSSLPGRIRGDLHVILASDAKEPLHAPLYWGRLARGRLQLHIVRGTHQSYLRCDVAETSALLNAILFDTPEMPHELAEPARPPRDSRA
ncbi:MAG TPA: thioesterase domain-containing protein [Candidatus Saccharimonadia bacterium]|nr:thioesterase domain-containing protein [Candidatus Saccharimonadia bacterium]